MSREGEKPLRSEGIRDDVSSLSERKHHSSVTCMEKPARAGQRKGARRVTVVLICRSTIYLTYA